MDPHGGGGRGNAAATCWSPTQTSLPAGPTSLPPCLPALSACLPACLPACSPACGLPQGLGELCKAVCKLHAPPTDMGGGEGGVGGGLAAAPTLVHCVLSAVNDTSDIFLSLLQCLPAHEGEGRAAGQFLGRCVRARIYVME